MPSNDPPGRPPSAYGQQLARARRFLERYRRIRAVESSPDRPPLDVIEDEMWAFFQNCWHVKDWLRHDPSVSEAVKDAAWNAVTASQPLMICADLANGIKHLSTDPARQYVGAEDGGVQLRQVGKGKYVV